MDISRAENRFAVCVHNEDYKASLELRKIYRIIPDDTAVGHNLLRVVDESGEDYLYPKHYFIPIELSQEIEEALLAAS
ncbi:MAG TPA: hypothetical protein VFJ72_14680 [Rubrobacteraceae bacterium]|nr:hypothetical protein [Rubrobacteraceae bacterium]